MTHKLALSSFEFKKNNKFSGWLSFREVNWIGEVLSCVVEEKASCISSRSSFLTTKCGQSAVTSSTDQWIMSCSCNSQNAWSTQTNLVVKFYKVPSFSIDVWTVFGATGSWGTGGRRSRRYSTTTPHWTCHCTTGAMNRARRSTASSITFDTCRKE